MSGAPVSPPVRPRRLSLRGFAESIQNEVFNLHRGLPGTWLQLSLRPGATIRRYVEWRDPLLTPPIRYLLVNLALCALVASWFGIGAEFLGGFERGYEEAARGTPEGMRLAALLEHLDIGLVLASVPAMAAALERCYRPWMNLAEALVFATYALAHVSLGLMLLAELLPSVLTEHGAIWLGLFALWPLYFALACRSYFAPEGCGMGRALTATLLMLLLAAMFSLSLTFIGMAIIVLS